MKMIQWIFVAVIVADLVYQLFGNVCSKAWCDYYDITHYAAFLAIALYLSKFKIKSVYGIFVLYFSYVLIISIWQSLVKVTIVAEAHYISNFILTAILILFEFNALTFT